MESHVYLRSGGLVSPAELASMFGGTFPVELCDLHTLSCLRHRSSFSQASSHAGTADPSAVAFERGNHVFASIAAHQQRLPCGLREASGALDVNSASEISRCTSVTMRRPVQVPTTMNLDRARGPAASFGALAGLRVVDLDQSSTAG